MLSSWTCTKCTGINEPPKQHCWNCKSDLAPQIDEAAKRGDAEAAQALEAREVAALKLRLRDEVMQQGTGGIKDLLSPYVGERIGINTTKAWELDAAELVGIQRDFFSVRCDGLTHHIPYGQVLRVVEAVKGPVTTGMFGNNRYAVVVTVFDLVIQKGSVGVGMSFPL